MDKKITFISQKHPSGVIPRNQLQMPVDVAQQCLLKAVNIHYSQVESIKEKYDIAILLIPKTPSDRDELFKLDVVSMARKIADKVWFMQEGPSWIFQDLPLHQQFWHYNVLAKVDGILCENDTDIPYFKGLIGSKKPVKSIHSVMVEDSIHEYRNITKQPKVMIGGNFCRWYGGFDSYIIAREFDLPISAPSMGRRVQGEEQIENLTHYPYMNWNEWIKTLAEHKYAVHLMPTIAAGTFAMNCGFLGIPCIGYEEADTQRLIHPELSVKVGDVERARKLVEKLKDPIYYDERSREAWGNYLRHFGEEQFHKYMTEVFDLC